MGAIIDISEALLDLGLAGSVTETERAEVNTCLNRAEGAVRRYLRYDPVQRSRTELYPGMDVQIAGTTGVWEANSAQAYLRTVSSGATSELQLRHIPIRSSPAIDLRIDYAAKSGAASGAFGSGSVKSEGVDFWPNYTRYDSDGNKVCDDGILRSVGLWPLEPGTVKIVYTAGYSAAELHGQDSIIDASPIIDAVLAETVRRMHKLQALKKKSGTGWVPGSLQSESLGDYSYSMGGSSADKMMGQQYDIMPETAEKLADFVNMGWILTG